MRQTLLSSWGRPLLGLGSAAWLMAQGCGGEGDPLGAARSPAQASDGGMAGADVDKCMDAADGQVCGEAQHCIRGRCVTNTCGDGVAAFGEACDDGNQAAADGCSPSCKTPPLTCGNAVLDEGEECDDGNWYNSDRCSNDCTVNECGNQREDDSEECDDGNRIDDDSCSNRCTENRCRNGRVDPGEECDDGNTTHDDVLLFSSKGERIQGDVCSNACVRFECGNARTEGDSLGGSEECDDGNMVNDDACSNSCTANRCGNRRIDPGEVCDGNTATEDCSDDCQTLSRNSACEECRKEQCSNFNDALDLVMGCYGENPEDPQFNDECIALVSCAKRTGCAYTEANLPLCFCGTFDQGACQTAGNQDGACMAEVYAATRTSVIADVIGNLGSTALPAGMAFYLLQCERDFCPDQCVTKK